MQVRSRRCSCPAHEGSFAASLASMDPLVLKGLEQILDPLEYLGCLEFLARMKRLGFLGRNPVLLEPLGLHLGHLEHLGSQE